MAKIIRSDSIDIMSSAPAPGTAKFTRKTATISLFENEDNPQKAIDIILSCSSTLNNKKSSAYSVAAQCITARIDDATLPTSVTSLSVPTASASVPANSSQNFYNERILATVLRGSNQSIFSATLNLIISESSGESSSTRTKEISLIIPPLKQNVVSDTSRVTYTVNNVKYDILNYK